MSRTSSRMHTRHLSNVVSAVLLLICIQMHSNKVHAQTYQPFPTGTATWNVVRCWYFFSPGWYDHYRLETDGSDTVYQGETYRKIYITSHLYHPPFDSVYPAEFFGGMREVNKQIFIFQKWGSVDTTAHLVYDFTNTAVGDTIYTSPLYGSSSDFTGKVVTATDTVLLGSTYHKRLLLQDPNSGMDVEYWTEGMGSSWGLPFASFWGATDNSYELLCFYDGVELEYSNPSPSYSYCTQPFPVLTCESVAGISAEPTNELAVELYPIPANDLLYLKTAAPEKGVLTVSIFDNTGKCVKTVQSSSGIMEISTVDLANGVYLAEIRSKELIAKRKLLIRRNE